MGTCPTALAVMPTVGVLLGADRELALIGLCALCAAWICLAQLCCCSGTVWPEAWRTSWRLVRLFTSFWTRGLCRKRARLISCRVRGQDVEGYPQPPSSHVGASRGCQLAHLHALVHAGVELFEVVLVRRVRRRCRAVECPVPPPQRDGACVGCLSMSVIWFMVWGL
jgi:hypothetical protein